MVQDSKTDFFDFRQGIEFIEAKLKDGDTAAIKENKGLIEEVIALLDQGKVRVCKADPSGHWQVNHWIRKAINYYFMLSPITDIEVGPFSYRDQIKLKANFAESQVRVVPPATARYGSYLAPGVVLMPSYVNIGAYIGSNTMIDTWATVGSCAQIGSDVHISGGVGIGGVLEPETSSPVIIGNGVFIGSRSIIVDSVRIHDHAVLAANVTLTGSTPIIDIRDGKFSEHKGWIPKNAVVLPGTKEKTVEGGKIHTSCAYIVAERNESTNKKTSLNDALRSFSHF